MALRFNKYKAKTRFAHVAYRKFAILFIALPVFAQSGGQNAIQSAAQGFTLNPVVINARSASPAADITGFGDAALKDVPISATVVGREQLQSSGARRLADLAQFDASVSDAYHSPG